MKKILAVDFDGVIHSYTSGWHGPTVIPDPPTRGAMKFLLLASRRFDIHVISSRTRYQGGKAAIRAWISSWALAELKDDFPGPQQLFVEFLEKIKFSSYRPLAHLTLDDRAITFVGNWPDLELVEAFKPWNKANP
jgi:hypothetical protein